MNLNHIQKVYPEIYSIVYFILARVQMNQIQVDCLVQTHSWRCLLAWRIRRTMWMVT